MRLNKSPFILLALWTIHRLAQLLSSCTSMNIMENGRPRIPMCSLSGIIMTWIKIKKVESWQATDHYPWANQFITRIFQTMPKWTKFGARQEVKFTAIQNFLFRQYSETNQTPRMIIKWYWFMRRITSRMVPLKLMWLFFSFFKLYFTTNNYLSTADVPGNMVDRPLTKLFKTKYVLWSPFQASWYALPSSNMSTDIFSSGWRQYA